MLASHCTQGWGWSVAGASGSKQHSGRGGPALQNIHGDWSWWVTPGALLANTLGLRRQWQPLLPHNSLLNPRGSWCYAGFKHMGSRAQAWGGSFHFSRVRKGWENDTFLSWACVYVPGCLTPACLFPYAPWDLLTWCPCGILAWFPLTLLPLGADLSR